jgi:hypothetical protein
MSALSTSPGVSWTERTSRNPFWKRQIMIVSRWLHIYLSMASFGILFFFAVTGLTLNHVDWFAKEQHTTQVRGTMDPKFVIKEISKLEVVEYLRNTYRIRGAVKDLRMRWLPIAIGAGRSPAKRSSTSGNSSRIVRS